MKKLHLVGFTADSDLILSARKGAKTGSFVVPLDDALVSAIDLARRRRDGELDTGEGGNVASPAAADKPRSSLSPREIQARLRAGASVAEVAAQAGADDEWVLRFAAPILAEQAKVIESAQRLTMAKTRRGPSIEALAPSVQWNLSDRGVRMSGDVFADCWSAYNLHGARWAVRFAYTSRKRHQVAEWEVDLRERSLVARNRLAGDLGHVEPGRRRPTAEELEAPAEPATAGAPPAPPPAPSRPANVRRPPVRAQSAPAAKRGATRTTKAASKTAATRPAKAADKAAAKPPTQAPASGRGGRVASVATAAQKAAGARRTTAAKAQPAAKTPARPAAQPVAKRSPRQPAPRKAAPARKKPGEAPGGAERASRGRKAEPAPEAEDRPSHLGRPPSPMKFANRATSLPMRRAASPYERPRPAPTPAPRRAEGSRPATPSPAPEPAPATAPEPANPANPRFEPRPEPDFTDPAAAAAAAVASRGRIRSGNEVGRRPKATRTEGVETPRPAVVILSTPGAEPQPPPAASVEDQERQARLASAERLRAALSEPPEPAAEPAPQPAPGAADASPTRARRGRRQAFST